MIKRIITTPSVSALVLQNTAKKIKRSDDNDITRNRHGPLTIRGYTKAYNQVTTAHTLYSKGLLRYCGLRVSNQEKAVDIVQETFVRVWLYLIDGNHIENDKSFLYTTARHLIIDEYRKKKTISLESLSVTNEYFVFEDFDEQYNLAEIACMMRKVHTLPPIYGSILVMRYVDDFSVKKIARLLSVTENIASVRIHRGLEKMRILAGIV